MVMERLNAARQFAIKQAGRLLRESRVTDPGPKKDRLPLGQKPSAEEIDKINLDLEWEEQSRRYVELGFHKELGLSAEDYLASLPKFEPQPEDYKGRFDQPLLVEKRIPWPRLAELAGISISDYLRSSLGQVEDWADNHSKAPTTTYCGWFNQWGQEFPEMIDPFQARNQLAPDATGGDCYEGIAKQIHHPEENENGQYFDLIGSAVGPGSVVYLDGWSGRPELYARWGDSADPSFRPLARGSKIVTG